MQHCCEVPEKKASSLHACPACGQRAKRVEQLTMEHLLRPGLPSQIGKTQYYFCEMATCPVVYFPYESGAAVFQKADLRVRVGLKETVDPIPICYCFGILRKAVWDEIEQTGASTVLSRVKAEVKAGHCACEVKNPSGKCCLGDVTRAVQQGLQQAQALQSFANKAKFVPQT